MHAHSRGIGVVSAWGGLTVNPLDLPHRPRRQNPSRVATVTAEYPSGSPRAPEFLSFALSGTTAEDGESFILVVGLLDQQVLEPGWSKPAREKLQVEAFQAAWPPLIEYEVAPGDDPPDFVLTLDELDPIALEVTQLTLPDYRRDIAQAREMSRSIRNVLDCDAERYQHLVGRSLQVALTTIPPRSDIAAVVSEILGGVSKDIGYVGEDVDFSEGPPQQWNSSRGFHGELGGCAIVTVQMGSHPELIEVHVTLANPAKVPMREIFQWLRDAIAAKDRPGRTMLSSSPSAHRMPQGSLRRSTHISTKHWRDIDSKLTKPLRTFPRCTSTTGRATM